jgi:hypothetical protein
MTHLFANLTHFGAMAFFALVVSITFAFLSKRTAIERLQYSLWAFLAFLVIAIGIGWIMYPFSR